MSELNHENQVEPIVAIAKRDWPNESINRHIKVAGGNQIVKVREQILFKSKCKIRL